ncbi:vacuolar protein sorting-associated protein 37B [Agrilus planipennis]|uniref:Vacuolar protein sorting-associated protein 37B n=1 Tax=Agrilus planipennis TaxID=224129 RepID=A0A1W4XTK8_AGRPL|nr:vacuolar protein sorting-associated protein 37B [Agrilus planipennis]
MSLAVIQSDCKRAISLISHLSNDELDEIMNNEEKLENLLKDLNQNYIKEIEAEKETLLASNNSLAEYNLGKEPLLTENREKIHQLSQEGAELSKSVKDKLQTVQDKNGDMSLETALALLQTAASEIEEESEKLAQKFLNNETDLEEYLDTFMIKRKLMHLRLVKAEKLAKILSRGLPNSQNYMNVPPTTINSSFFPGTVFPPVPPASVPYPTGPLNMPLPPGGVPRYFQNHF